MSIHESSDSDQGDSERNHDLLPKESKADRKPVDPKDPFATFKHAPRKPDGDPWDILLKPKLEADRVRCNAWKDEVQNLLIFAGLFSAVVTAFVIESYKFLQPDPNAAVIGLLFLIASNLNNTSMLPPSVDPASITTSFLQNSSSVRINVFWFLSLILSLTTVLIGTIALQWLREHQSYPNFSPKEKAAILHMRSQALEAWYVPVVFSVLPLLLQAALVLFLAGLIDFSLPLGLKLIIPVAVAIGLTLLFLGATTVLPTFQGLSFFFRHSYRHVPTPCPFKSPQSHAIRILCVYLMRLVSSVFPNSEWDIRKKFSHYTWRFLPLHQHPFFPFIYTIWQQITWLTFDQEWLSLRDACHQSILHNDAEHVFEHREFWYDWKAFPLSDMTQCVIDAVQENSTTRYIENFFSATIHCFQEISASTWMANTTYVDDSYVLRRKAYRNHYFEQLYPSRKPCYSISNYLLDSGSNEIHRYATKTTALRIFTQEQIFYFLDLIYESHSSSAEQLHQYRVELWSHIIPNIEALHLISAIDPSPPIPTLLGGYPLLSMFYALSSAWTHARPTVANILSMVFKLAASHAVSQDQSLHSMCAHYQMAEVLHTLASEINAYMAWPERNAPHVDYPNWQEDMQKCDVQYILIFKFVAGHLGDEISDSERNSKEDTPSVLFYLASIFLWYLVDRHSVLNILEDKDDHFDQGLRSLLEALLQYAVWTRTTGKKTNLLETRFAGEDQSCRHDKPLIRFSEKWWDIVFERVCSTGVKIAEQGPTVTEGSDPNSRPSPSAQDEQKTTDVVTTPAALPSPSTAPGVVGHLTAFKVPATDTDAIDHNEISHISLQPASLTRTFPSQDDHDENMKRQALSDSPTTTEHTTATNKVLDPISDPPFIHSQPSQALPNPPTIHLPEGNHATAEAVTQAPLLLPTPLPSGEVGLAPQQVVADGTGDEQRPIQTAGGPHLTIEVGSPTDPGHRKVIGITGADDNIPEDQPRSEDTAVCIEPPK